MTPKQVMQAMDAANDAPLLRMEWILRFIADRVPNAKTNSGEIVDSAPRFATWLLEMAEAAETMKSRQYKKAKP